MDEVLMSIVSALRSAIQTISSHPDVRVIRCAIGKKAPASVLERAREDRYTPALLIEIGAEMNGLEFEWGFKPSGRSRKVIPVGRIHIPTLARNLQGWGLADGFGAELPEIAESLRVLDLGPLSAGLSISPCFAEGSFGVWSHYDDIYDPDLPIDEEAYLVAAAENLFMPQWLRATCDGRETPPEIVAARERLGVSPQK